MAVINGIKSAIMLIINLGPTVMMPIIMTIIGLCLGVKFARSLKGGLLVGIGFIGLNATVSILTGAVQPAVDNMVKLFGLNLTVIDVGWPSASAIAFGTAVGVAMIPLGIVINVIMLLTKSTRTVDVDIWDFWHFAFSGSIVYALTHNMLIALSLAAVNMVVIMVIADRTAKGTEEILGLPGITFPHGLAGSFVPIAYVLDKIIDKIPGINKIKLDENAINKKLGLIGDPAILGLIVGLDCAAGIGHPVVLAMSVIMVPITLLLAIILPGNEFLPLVGLCGICFQFPLIVAITKGDFFRTFLIGIVVMGLGLYIGTNLAPLFTSAAQAAHFPIPDGAALISSIDYGSNPIPWLLVQITNLGPVFIIVVIALTVLLALWNRKQILREEQEEAKAANQGE